jgi:glycosyltransferase involved in cell wall biosynthesis
MKICHVIGDSQFGGGSKIIASLAACATNKGWDVSVLTTNPAFAGVLKAAGIEVIDLDCIWRKINPYRDLQGLKKLTDFFRSNHFDMVHTHTSKAGFVGRRAAYKAGVRAIIHTVHGFSFHEHSGRLPLVIYSNLEKLAAGWCDRIVTVSNFHRDWALELGIGSPGKVLSIPNGIPDLVPGLDAKREEIRRGLGLASEEFVILSAGRLANQKGLEDLIDAAAILRDQGEFAFRVLLPGEGPLETVLVDKIRMLGLEDNVDLLGFRSDIAELLVGSDCVALASIREGLSIALLEAMSAEKPIVATNISSNLEAASSGTDAMIVPCSDPRALANAISRFASEPRLREDFSKLARKVYRERYTSERMLVSYMDLYRNVIKEKTPDL